MTKIDEKPQTKTPREPLQEFHFPEFSRTVLAPNKEEALRIIKSEGGEK